MSHNDVLAALDLGSNSAHLLVAEVLPPAHIRRVATRKERLRLAESVARRGRLGRGTRRRVLDTVGDLVAAAAKAGATEVTAVATDALRHAEDGPRLVAAIARDLGLRVRVLGGLEEAALSFRGISAALRIEEPLLGLDLGGGSLEIACGQGGRLVEGASLPLGSARASTRFVHDPPLPDECAALHADALAQVQAVAGRLLGSCGGVAPEAAGTAGTIRDFGRLGLALATGVESQRIRGLAVTRGQLERALERLVALSTRARSGLPGLSGSRLDILPAGGLVTLAAMEALGLDRLLLCDWGLREGVLLDALREEEIVSRRDFSPL